MKDASLPNSISRRAWLKQTVLFSTSSLLGSKLSGQEAALPSALPEESLHFLAFGDFGSKNEQQLLMAETLNRYASSLPYPLEAVFALGDNFYGKMMPDRMQTHFEDLYLADKIRCPFYVCFGNHDYEPVRFGLNPEPMKYQIEMDYSLKYPQSRWKAPSKWYCRNFYHQGKPRLRLIVMDSNIREGELTPNEKIAQRRFLEQVIQQGTQAPWTILMLHHPFFSESIKRGDNELLHRLYGEFITKSDADLVLSGHDHTLQHLNVEGYKAHFIVSGGGGAKLHDIHPSQRGFAQSNLGFNHIEVHDSYLKVNFLNSEGKSLHAFLQSSNGSVKVQS